MPDQQSYTYRYPRPMVTVDAVVFGLDGGALSILLVERKHDPYAGRWALPGGFIEMDEDLDAAAARELAEETNIAGVQLLQFRTFGAPDRDPRGRAVTVGFLTVVDKARHTPEAADDAAKAEWWPLDALPALAFDHDEILEYAVRRLHVLTGISRVAPWLFAEVPESTVARALGQTNAGKGGDA